MSYTAVALAASGAEEPAVELIAELDCNLGESLYQLSLLLNILNFQLSILVANFINYHLFLVSNYHDNFVN